MLQLFGYWRSSASFRVRLVLQLKGLSYEQHPVHLGKGEQKEKAYRRINPQGLVPFLIDSEVQVGQSVAIMEYLDETYPAHPLMPSAAQERARVRQIVNMIACDVHPLDNLRVLNYLEQELGQSKTARDAWYRHWIDETFKALEPLLMTTAGVYCVGNEVTLADCMLVPQVYNARRYNMTLDDYPTIARIVANCEQLQAFIKAAPANQPDAQG
ncbi:MULTISPECIES: maleylacetoacetate isomerase [Aeromonas]|uniref:Maleylacetoacetate isomerase n=1 Tax=Aeromonas encheleia TaxID=73010 RepID=A0AAE9MI85_9GAMM|nr:MULTISPECIES: maleylacetoacetate isomerase [Aeromonas]MBV7436917.1 maleylacetoacetate isomerase [Aeromonas sp. sif2416]USV59059.1 maleylacetoacetate isomerase [Aeromonas encheleia]